MFKTAVITLINKTQSFLSDEISISEYHQIIAEYETKFTKLAFTDEKYKTQEVFDFFNLCHELADATSFDNEQKDAFLIANTILTNYLGKMYSSKEWIDLVKMRGPIEGISEVKCLNCQNTFPVITFSGFIDYINASCSQCGSILFIDKYNSKLSELFTEHKDENTVLHMIESILPRCPNDNGSFIFTFAHQAPFGTTHFRCINCNSDKMIEKELSRYEYFQSHEKYYCDNKFRLTTAST